MAEALKWIANHVPTLVYAPQARQLCTEDVSDLEAEFPLPTWTFARKDPDGTTLPQIIGHRGDKTRQPENSMLAFKSAAEAGAQCIETDVHVTRDGVVVLTHDGNLKRCFGKDANVIDLDWSEVAALRSTRAPHVPMPRLVDLLTWLVEPSHEDLWVLLDIKVDVDPAIIMPLIGEVIAGAPAAATRPWNQRIVLGVWGTKYLRLAQRHLPAFAVTNIGFSTLYARRFFRHPFVCFNILAIVICLPVIGPRFVHSAKKARRSITVWTVNDERMMRYLTSLGVDGIITDDPARLAQVFDEWRAGHRDASLPLQIQIMALWYNCVAIFFVLLLLQWRVRDLIDGGRGKVRSWRYKQISGFADALAPRLT